MNLGQLKKNTIKSEKTTKSVSRLNNIKFEVKEYKFLNFLIYETIIINFKQQENNLNYKSDKLNKLTLKIKIFILLSLLLLLSLIIFNFTIFILNTQSYINYKFIFDVLFINKTKIPLINTLNTTLLDTLLIFCDYYKML